jgi:hypothetical protein
MQQREVVGVVAQGRNPAVLIGLTTSSASAHRRRRVSASRAISNLRIIASHSQEAPTYLT